MTPTSRSLAYLRERGYQVAVVERWNAHARVRQDAFGFGDILACDMELDRVSKDRGEIVLVQVTSGTNVSARCRKIEAEPRALAWLRAGGRIYVHGWEKKGPRGKAKRWRVRALSAFKMGDVIAWETVD